MNTETIGCTETMTETLVPAEDPPVVFVIYFGGADPRFAEILGRWFEFYHASGCPWPARVLTDLETAPRPIGHVVREQALVRVDAAEYAQVIRPGNAFDRKSAIICAALRQLPARSVVVDSDAFFLRDPADMLEPFTRLPFAMAEDAGRRTIPLMDEGVLIPEQSSSVMVFGGGEMEKGGGGKEKGEGGREKGERGRQKLVAEYVKAWHELAETPNQSALEVDIREQRAWSVVKHRTGAPLLPRECNDSRFWHGPTGATRIYHAHGKEKFSRT